MLSEKVIANNTPTPFRWWFLPSWMGLDSPCVVLTWTWATSRVSGIPLPMRPAAALFFVVWFIYLSDRLIDVARCNDWTNPTGRLRFGRNFRPLFLMCLGICIAGILAFLWTGLPYEVLERAVVVALGVGLHGLLFVVPVIFRRKLPGKEFGVGLFFALGVYTCLGSVKQTLPFLGSLALVVAFACLVIAARDADSDRTNDPGGASWWWQTMNRDLLWLGMAFTLASAMIAVLANETSFYLSLTAAFAVLTILHFVAPKLSGDTVRAFADFALLTPIPIIGVLANARM